MIRRLLLSMFIISIFGNINAQDIKIINPGSSDALNGGYYYEISSQSNPDMYKTFWVVNQTASDKVIKVRRVEVTSVSGTENATCWEICPSAIAAGSDIDWESPYTANVLANDTNKSFSAHLYPEGVAGCSHYRYYWYFDDMSYIDSVDIFFNHGEVCQQVASNESIGLIDFSVNIFPNPSNGTVNLDLQVPSNKNYVLNVVNVVGQNVISNQKVTNGVSKLDWSHLNPGMYFVMLYDGEKAVKTKKIQIVK